MKDDKQRFLAAFYSRKEYGNIVKNFPPLMKAELFVLAIAVAVFLGDDWNQAAVMAVCTAVCLMRGDRTILHFLSLFLKAGVILAFFLIVINAAFQPGEHIYFSWWIFIFTREGLIYGIQRTLFVLAVLSAIICFYLITPMQDLSDALEKHGMSRQSSYVFLASLQGVGDLGKSVKTIIASQNARGVETEGNLIIRLKSLIPVLLPVFLSSVSATEEKAIAMKTRAFSAGKHPTRACELREATKGEWLFFIAVNALVLGLLIQRAVL